MLNDKEIRNNREKIISLLKSLNREGNDKVIEYLDKNSFFEMPSSLKRHHNWPGGLAQHCLGVYDRLTKTGENLSQENIIVTSLLHDICKIGKLFKSDKGEWLEHKDEELEIQGHGERSVKILENLNFHLSKEEEKAIKWHMGGWKIGNQPKEEIRDFFMTKKYDLWRLLHNADRYDASHNGKDKIIPNN